MLAIPHSGGGGAEPGNPAEPELRRLRREVERLRGQVRRLKALYASTHVINSSLAPEDIVSRVVGIIDSHFRRCYCAVLLIPEGSPDTLEVYAASPRYRAEVRNLRIHVSQGLSGRAVRSGRTVVAPDVRLEPDYIPGLPGCRSSAAVPIRYGDRVVGVLNLESPKVAAFSEEDVQLLESFASQLAVAIENARLFQATQRLAITDPNTGLYNYRHLQQELAREVSRARRHDLPFSVAIVELDRFKMINDRYGHLFGDLVLREFGQLLRGALRQEDEVFRYGGDEFAVIFPETDREAAVAALTRVLETARAHRFSNEHATMEGVTFTAGVAAFPEHGEDAASLLHHADAAMYRGKRAGGCRIALYGNDAFVFPAS